MDEKMKRFFEYQVKIAEIDMEDNKEFPELYKDLKQSRDVFVGMIDCFSYLAMQYNHFE